MTSEDLEVEDERAEFRRWFTSILILPNSSCFKRDVLRDCQTDLWMAWKKRASAWDARMRGGDNDG